MLLINTKMENEIRVFPVDISSDISFDISSVDISSDTKQREKFYT